MSAALASPAALWALAVSGVLGLVTGAIGVLVPAVLADNGLGPGGIGLAVAVSSVIWIGSATRAARIQLRRIDVRTTGIATATLAAALLLPVASRSSVAVIGFLAAAAASRALLGSLIYPLGAGAASEAESTSYAGLLNLVWAVPALVTPVLAGAAQQQGATGAAFAVVGAIVGVVGLGMVATARRSTPLPA